MALRAVLAQRRNDIIADWLARTFRTYPTHTAHFLSHERDPFRNPVGEALKEGLPVLFDELAGDMDLARVTPVLDEIVRMRAVQDFTPGEAVGFIFLLKATLRESLGSQQLAAAGHEELAELDQRIDRLALLGFDVFVKCREKVFEIQAKQARRSVYLLERAHPAFAPTEAEEESEIHPGRRPDST